MGLKLDRRCLLGGLAAVVGTAAAPLLPLLERLGVGQHVPVRVVEALRSFGYPGRVQPLRDEDVLHVSKWGG